MFTDMLEPRILTEIESFAYVGDCFGSMVATAAVYIDGTTFNADLVTYTFYNPSQPLIVTYHYPAVTLSSLNPGATVTFV